MGGGKLHGPAVRAASPHAAAMATTQPQAKSLNVLSESVTARVVQKRTKSVVAGHRRDGLGHRPRGWH